MTDEEFRKDIATSLNFVWVLLAAIFLTLVVMCATAHAADHMIGDSLCIDSISGVAIKWNSVDTTPWRPFRDSLRSEPGQTFTDTVEVFYLDTIGWRIDTVTVPTECPEHRPGCLVFHWKDEVILVADTEKRIVARFVPDDWTKFGQWQMKRVYR